MSTNRDYYELLGVSRDADKDAIKKAYRKLALKYHPDRNKEADAAERFKEISEAYAILSDDQKRQTYDRFGHAGVDQQYSQEDIFRTADFGAAGFDLGDLFNIFFGGRGGGGFGGFGRPAGPRPGRDLRYDLVVALEDVLNGAEKKFRVRRLDTCDACKGAGGKGKKTCAECAGEGEVRRVARTPFGIMQQVSACTACRGRGQTVETPCATCHGEGRVEAVRTITFRVPPGVPSGANLRLRGEGEAGEPGAPAGDLYVIVQVKEHEVFQRDGDDLHVIAPLSFPQAALGDTVEVPLLDGQKEKLRVPAGTQFGERFTIKGKGLPRLNARGARGDLVAHVRVYTPEKLTTKQRELYEELAALEGTGPKRAKFLEDLRKRFT